MKLRAIPLLCAAVVAGCASKHVTVGDQCPSPYNERAQVAQKDGGSAKLFGTSCAPCDEKDIKYDARGCPKYVTLESCGGPICIGSMQLPSASADEDAGETTTDAAVADAQANQEDAGAH